MLPARSRRRMPLVMPTTVHIRRSYMECRYGQLHMATAYPSGGGFDERVPVICLHPAGSSHHYFQPLLPELGIDRSVYTIDLPGFGQSDAASENTPVAMAAAISDFIDGLRLRNVDVVGVQLGSLVAAELAATKPQQVRKVVLASVPHFTAQEARSLEWTAAAALPQADGSHLLKEWQRLVQSRGSQVSPEQLTDELADALQGRRQTVTATQAMLEFPTAKRLAGLTQPGLVLRGHDEYREHSLRARSAYPHANGEELPDCGTNIFAVNPQRTLQLIRQFLG